MLIDGQEVFSMPEKELTVFRRRNIGFIFQSFHLIPELNVGRVLFPEPDSPTIAMNSPLPTEKFTWSRACTLASPFP